MNINERLSKIAAMTTKNNWRFNPPIPLAEVESIENKYGFALPEDYKLFITQIGNGGEIPPLHDGEPIQFLPFQDAPALKQVKNDFPLSESWNWDADLNFSPDNPEDRKNWQRVQENGLIVLAQEDVEGGQIYFLIVSGPNRGEIWERDESGVLRLPNCKFFDWLELYLTRQLIPYTDKLFRQEKEKCQMSEELSTIKSLMFGKWGKNIRWRPTIPLNAIRDFEQRHHISLPEDYVAFITEISDGCENFPSANSHGKGGVFYSLEQLDCLPNLDKAFYFTELTEEIRRRLTKPLGPNAYTWKNPIWTSLFSELPQEEPLSPVWNCKEYSVLHGVLPFAYYNDEQFLHTQPFLIITGPLRGQVWRTTISTLRPDADTFYQWVIKMLKGDAR